MSKTRAVAVGAGAGLFWPPVLFDAEVQVIERRAYRLTVIVIVFGLDLEVSWKI
jgi:hypothetical protein